MSKQPGPRSTPSVDRERAGGQRAERPDRVVVAEHQHPDGPVPSRQRRWVRPSITIRSGSTPSRRAPTRATTSAERATAARSAEGDSHSTSSRQVGEQLARGPSVHPRRGARHRSARSARRSAARRTSPASRSRPPAACTSEQGRADRAPAGTRRPGPAPARRAGRVIVVRSVGPSSPTSTSMRTDGPLVGADVRRDVDRPTGSAGGASGSRHLDAGELGEDLAVEVLVEVAGVAAVGEQRDREALPRAGPAGTPACPMVLPSWPIRRWPSQPKRIQPRPHESPRMYLSGRSAWCSAIAVGGLLAEQPGAVGRDAAGQVQPREARARRRRSAVIRPAGPIERGSCQTGAATCSPSCVDVADGGARAAAPPRAA